MAALQAGGDFGACDYWRVWNRGLPFGQMLAGAHEAAHRTLAATTSWGLVTSVFALLAEARPSSGLPSVVRGMLAASRNCHEAYATYVSLAFSDQAAALQEYPQYRRRLAEAESLVRHLPPVPARHWALEAAITACMNVPVVQRVLARGIEQFSLADVRSAEYPDQRMRVLAAVSEVEWDGIWQRLREEFADWSEWSVLGEPVAGADRSRVGDLPDDLLLAFQERAYEEIAACLARRGLVSLRWQEYSDALAVLIPVAADFSQSSRETARLVDLLRPMTHSASFAGQGRLVRRAEPGPAHLIHAASLDDIGWRNLLQGTPPRTYLYVLARRTWDLMASYRIADDELRLLPSDPNTTVTLLRADPRQEDHGPLLIVLDSAAELASAVELIRPAWVLSNPSVMTFHDAGWVDEWLTPLARFGPLGFRIDLDPIVLLDSWCKPSNRVRYSFFDMRDETGQLSRVFICQWSSLPAEHAFAAVTSPDLAAHLGGHLAERHAACSERDDRLIGEVVDWLRVIVSTMLDDQHEFRFHGVVQTRLVMQDGQTG